MFNFLRTEPQVTNNRVRPRYKTFDTKLNELIASHQGRADTRYEALRAAMLREAQGLIDVYADAIGSELAFQDSWFVVRWIATTGGFEIVVKVNQGMLESERLVYCTNLAAQLTVILHKQVELFEICENSQVPGFAVFLRM